MYGYISEKARIFLKVKPEIYRKQDAFGMPDVDLTEEELDLLKSGCKQIVEGKGQTPDNPLTDIGIHGFTILMELFHFEKCMQSIYKSTNEGFLDKMECVHVVTGQELVLYNFVKKGS